MMSNKNYLASDFSLRSLIFAAIPAYVFPFVMSFASGFLLQKAELMKASYTTIGLSSLLATILSFVLLWQFDSRHILTQSKWTKSLIVIMLVISIGALCASILQPPSEHFNITFSAFLGATILTIRQNVKRNKNEQS